MSNGVITVRVDGQSEGISTLELGGKEILSQEGAQQVARVFKDSATASLLTSLDLRFAAYIEQSHDALIPRLECRVAPNQHFFFSCLLLAKITIFEMLAPGIISCAKVAAPP
jgi:hypothetical protein